MVVVKRRVKRDHPTPPVPTHTDARTWRCEFCKGTLHAARGQTPEAVAKVHSWTCPALPPPPQPRRP